MSTANTVSIRLEVTGTPETITQIKSVVTNLQGVQNQVNAMKGATSGLTAGIAPLTNLNNALKATGDQAVQTQSKLSKIGQTLASQGAAFGVVSASIWGVYNAYDSLAKVEIRADQAATRVKTTQTTLRTLQDRLEQSQRAGNLTIEQTAVLEEKIANTKQKLAVQIERNADLQQDVNEAWAQFASQIGPQVIAAGGSIAQLVTSLGQKGGILQKGMQSLKGSILSLAATFGVVNTEGGKINFAGIAKGFVGIGGPVLAIVGAIWLLAGAYQGMQNVSKGVIETLNLQVDALGPLQIAWLHLQNTLANMHLAPALTAKEKADLEFYDKLTVEQLDKKVKEAQKKGFDANKAMIAGFTDPKVLTDQLSKITGPLSAAFMNLGKTTGADFGMGVEEGITASLVDITDVVKQSISAGSKNVSGQGDILAASFFIAGQKQGLLFQDMEKAVTPYIEKLKQLKVADDVVADVQSKLNGVFETYEKRLTDAKFAAGDAVVEATNLRNEHTADVALFDKYNEQNLKHGIIVDKNNKVYKDGIDITQDVITQKKIEANMLDEVRNLYVASNTSLLEQAKSLGMNEEHLKHYTANTQQSRDQIQALNEDLSANIVDLARQNNSFQLGANAIVNYNLAVAEGVKQAGDLVLGIQNSSAQASGFTTELDRLAKSGNTTAKTLADMQQEFGLTAKQTMSVASGAQNMAEVFSNLADLMNSQLNPAVEEFETKLRGLSNKDLKKQLKELDFGLTWKGKNNFDDIVKDAGEKMNKLGKLAEQFKDIVTGVQLVIDSGISGKQGKKALEQGVDALLIKFDAMAKKDKELKDLTGFRNMLKNIGTPEEWNRHAGSIALFNKYMADNHLEDWEKAAINAKLSQENLNTATDDGTTSTSALNEEQQKIADNSVLARTVVQLTIDYDDQTRAVTALSDAYAILNKNRAGGTQTSGTTNTGFKNVFEWVLPEDQKKLDKAQEDIPPRQIGENENKGTGDPIDAAQKLQTALANLAKEGANSLSILVNAAKAHTTTLVTYFSKTIPTALATSQTYFANLAIQGGNSLSILVNSAKVHVTTLMTYMQKTIPVAAQTSQTALANLATQGSNSLALLSKGAGTATTSINTYLRKTIPVAAQASQTSLANLDNEGSKSLMELAHFSSVAANGIVNNLGKAQKAAEDLGSAIDDLDGKKADITVTTTYVTKHVNAQHGFHGIISQPTNFTVGEGFKPEMVTVTPLSEAGASRSMTLPPVVSTEISTGSKNRHVSGPTIIHMEVPVYLFPNGDIIKKLVREIPLSDIGMFATA